MTRDEAWAQWSMQRYARLLESPRSVYMAGWDAAWAARKALDAEIASDEAKAHTTEIERNEAASVDKWIDRRAKAETIAQLSHAGHACLIVKYRIEGVE